MKNPSEEDAGQTRQVRIPVGGDPGASTRTVMLEGDLTVPPRSTGIVLFAHGSGSGRHSPRNRCVAGVIREAGIATLLFDLLTRDEETEDNVTRRLRFDIELLARRLVQAGRWTASQPGTQRLGIGYFGASTGGAAALVAAAETGAAIEAVVSRGGRPDLAGGRLESVRSPTLLIVGERDGTVLELNRAAYARLRCENELKIIPRATHLFEEPGALEEVARLAADWFRCHLRPR
ncbi:MAG TPA: alpha/beta hydrolase [Candidatus Angelobacter sp.]|nr:alpha/beta hydrolase [Candidatus Angelobacter sp.]